MLKSERKYAVEVMSYALPMEQTLGDRIVMLRKSRKMTQEQLGSELGVSAASVSLWESGATKDLKIENFLRFCDYFNCDPHWLAFGEDSPPWAAPPPPGKQRTA
jgi:transcriptional regulator with XRE-family HTH domain